jgi:hypothetical protein
LWWTFGEQGNLSVNKQSLCKVDVLVYKIVTCYYTIYALCIHSTLYFTLQVHHNIAASSDVYKENCKINLKIIFFALTSVESRYQSFTGFCIPTFVSYWFFIPEDGPRGPKHVVNKHQLSSILITPTNAQTDIYLD